jgi:hypothetical protein
MAANSRPPISARISVYSVAVALAAWSGSLDLFAQSNSAVRTWKDESGKFAVVAALVSSDAMGVRLRKENGVELTVPLERLSEADRRFLTSLAMPVNLPPQPAEEKTRPAQSASTDVLDALVHVSYPHSGVEPRLRGLVIHRDEERAYVVLLDYPEILFKQREYYESKGQKPKLTIIWGFTGKERRVEAELFETPQGTSAVGGVTWVLAAPASEMPAPLDLQQSMDVKKGDELQLVGVVQAENGKWVRNIAKAAVLTAQKSDGTRPQLRIQPMQGQVAGRLVLGPDGKALAFTLPQWSYDAFGGRLTVLSELSPIAAPRLEP